MLGSETVMGGARARVGGVNRFVRAEFGSRINSKKTIEESTQQSFLRVKK